MFARVEGLESRRLFSIPAGAVQIGNNLFFAQSDATHGNELWKSDLDGGNAQMVKDIWAGATGSKPQQLFNFNGELYFSADAAYNGQGRELFKSDGTEAGTVLVKDIYGAGGSSNPRNFMVVNNHLLFQAASTSTVGTLRVTDGTAAGTIQLFPQEINPSEPKSMRIVDNVLYFEGFSEARLQTELWRSDGTRAGTFQITGGMIVDRSLHIFGSNGNDYIQVSDNSGITNVNIAGFGSQDFDDNDFDTIAAYGLTGNDLIVFDTSVTKAASINGGAGNDTIVGGSGNDSLIGFGGNDYLDGAAGNDYLVDTISSAFGDFDTLLGGPGRDRILPGFGTDSVNGGADNDTIIAGAGDESIDGGGGSDTVDYSQYVTSGITFQGNILTLNSLGKVDSLHNIGVLLTGNGNDVMNIDRNITGIFYVDSGGGNDQIDLNGDGSPITVHGGAGDDTLIGHNANDLLDGGAGTNQINPPTIQQVTGGLVNVGGTSGDDRIIVRRNAVNAALIDVSVNGVANSYRISDVTFIQIDGKAGNDWIQFDQSGGPLVFSTKLYGGTGDDVIYGSAGADQIRGGDGNDYISGGAGNDALYGDAGNDKVYGGDGNDYLDGGAGADMLRGDAGTDRIIATVGLDDYAKNKGDLLTLTH